MKKILATAGVVALTPVAIGAVSLMAVIAAQDKAAAASAASGGLTGVPPEYEPWIKKASQSCQHPALTPALLAAQLNAESGFNAKAVSPAGAEGPAQFMPGTWATWGRDDAGDGHPSPFNIPDAVMAQGRFMCSLIGQAQSSGIAGDVQALALAGYNAGWDAVVRYHGVPPYPETQNYVTAILAAVPKFQGSPLAPPVTGTGTGPDAVRKAMTQLGVPYSYGGGTPSGPTTGFCDGTYGMHNGVCLATTTVGWDCSSLVQYGYWPTVRLPRTAAEQYAATADRPVAQANLQVGDLLFWSHGGESGIYHVALYAGNGQILEAPQTWDEASHAGDKVKIAAVSAMPAGNYYGATRP